MCEAYTYIQAAAVYPRGGVPVREKTATSQ
jgi:hypothetical protein